MNDAAMDIDKKRVVITKGYDKVESGKKSYLKNKARQPYVTTKIPEKWKSESSCSR